MGMYMPAVVLKARPPRRRQRRRHGGRQRPDDRPQPFRPGRHDLSQGDFNGDGTVDVNDLTIVLAQLRPERGIVRRRQSPPCRNRCAGFVGRWVRQPIGLRPAGGTSLSPNRPTARWLRYRAAQEGWCFWPRRVRISLSSKPFLLLAFSALVLLRLFGDRARHSQ